MQTRVPEINNVLKKRCVGFTKRILLSTLFVLPGLASPSLIAAFAQAGAPAATQTPAGAVAAGQRKYYRPERQGNHVAPAGRWENEVAG
jgi:hypothetical protein